MECHGGGSCGVTESVPMRAALLNGFSNFALNPFSMNFLRIAGSERFQRLSKEGFWIVFGQAAAVVGLLVEVRLLTELLDPASYGELALGMTVATLVNQVVLGPLGNGVVRFYAPAVEQGDLGGHLNAVRRLMLSPRMNSAEITTATAPRTTTKPSTPRLQTISTPARPSANALPTSGFLHQVRISPGNALASWAS